MEKGNYTESDKICFENVKWELEQSMVYLSDCNSRKLSYFRLALAILSVFATGLGVYVNALSRASSDDLPLIISTETKIVVCFALVLSSLFVYSIIKEIFSIHMSRVQIFRQMNCLRQVMDSIRYKKHLGEYPTEKEQLKDRSTAYWEVFGKHRKLDIDNTNLRNSEKNWYRSPDFFMIAVLFITIISLNLGSLWYLLSLAEGGKAVILLAGLISGGVAVYLVSDIYKSRKRFKQSLKIVG
ncbi:hypothetical protein ACVS2C_004799 [Vibrio parahaemolyticus]|uniref:hypothetical protein n=1 Tax=Vibrio harveyi group TaxID=717610 RepID=UPI0005F0A0E0|nr:MULTISPECIES: hypothetical protein [Vibrio harveyi group]EGQ9162786.1 hypothetical protein [Vibrio parahaemolyticus]EGR1384327.1 hypothetical protein [Vibrio parahaemolyticus]EJS4022004.1 hypothetical protein [Vibrio parahaemolyticus]ELA7501199.1 hypothetical protein [Vibrio parahaemolyticus]ELA7676401.1 hypothetical protein [Vibrio parahaemolyticus]